MEGALLDFLFLLLSYFSGSADHDHERDWPSRVKYFFLVRNNSNN